MFKKSINSLMIGVISLIVFVSIGSLVVYVSSSSQKIALHIQEDSLKEIGNSLLNVCEDFLQEELITTKTLALRPEIIEAVQTGYGEDATNVFAEAIRLSNGKIAVAIAFDMKGAIITGTNIKGDILTSKDSGDKKYSAGIVDGKDIFISPYLLKSQKTQKLLGCIGVAVKDRNGRVIGGVAIMPNFDALFERYISPFHFGKHGYVFVLDDKGRVLAHPDKTKILNDVSKLNFASYALKHKSGSLDYAFNGVEKFLLFREVPSTKWIIGLTANHSEMASGAIHQRNVLLGVGLVNIVAVILAILFISRRLIFGPLSRIVSFVGKVADGNYQAELQGKFQFELVSLADDIKAMVAEIKNKIGFSQGALQAIKTPALVIGTDQKIIWANQEVVDLVGLNEKPEDIIGWSGGKFLYDEENKQTLSDKAIAEQRAMSADVDYTNRLGDKRAISIATTPFYDMDNNLLGAFSFWMDLTEIKAQQRKIEAQNEKIAETAREAFAVADQMAGAAEELSAQIEQSSKGTDIQRQRVTETATSMEEMNSTVLEVARNASGAAEGSDNAKIKAEEGQKIVESAINAITQVQNQAQQLKVNMETLGQQAEDIGNVMNVISDIADQTNLLALNAAIEAARAGEAGRGFAVVADEVRKLAEKTMTATKEVGDAIENIQQGTRGAAVGMDRAVKSVEEATTLAGRSGEALSEIVNLVDQASDQVRSIATASEEQSASSEEINMAVGEINRISSETAEAMEQSASAIADLARLAQELNRLIQDLQDA